MSRAMDYIHSLFPPSYDGHKELQRLHEQLRAIESIKEVTESKGWQDIKRWAVDNVVEYDAAIERILGIKTFARSGSLNLGGI